MLSTELYNRDLQLIVENSKAAGARGDYPAQERIVNHLLKLLDYAKAHGLVLDTRSGQFRFKRNGYSPEFLYIRVE